MRSGTRIRPRLFRAIAAHPLLGNKSWEPFALDCDNLEPFVREVIAPFPMLLARKHQILIALEEARSNILRHAGGPRLAIGFVDRGGKRGPPPVPPEALEFLLADSGPGFTIAGVLPPYPAEMVGQTYDFRWTIDGVVSCRIVESNMIAIGFRSAPQDTEGAHFSNLAPNGLGLSIISKVMDRVVYLTHVGPGNLLWLRLEIPGKSNS